VPAVCWLLSETVINDRLASQDPGDPVAVASSRLADRAVSCGIDARRLTVCPPPCLAPLEAEPPASNEERPIDVALFANVGPVDAASLGLELPSYAQIWECAVDLLKARIETFTDDEAEKLLARAEAKMRSAIDEPSVRRDALGAFPSHVAPSLLARFIAQALVKNDIRVRIHGTGWDKAFDAQMGEPAATIARRGEIMRRARIVVQAEVTGRVTTNALLAAGSGAVLIARTHPCDQQPGGLHTLLEPEREILTFRHARELVEQIRRLLGDETARRSIAARAWQRCRSDHGPAARLQALRAAATSFSTDFPS